MFYMIYLKDDRQDKRYRVINPKTSCYIDRLIYAPRFTILCGKPTPLGVGWIALNT